MATINLPDGSIIIDDSELKPSYQARLLAHEGMTPTDIVSELSYTGCSLTDVQRWIAEAPYESPETYWMRRYNEGTHMQDDEEDTAE